jgi:hypothetical protein
MRTVSNVIAKTNLLGYAVDIEWQNPPASDFGVGASMIGIRIVRRQRTFPVSVDDGDVVYPLNYSATGPQFGPPVSRFSDRDLKPLFRYYYTIFTVDNANNFYFDDSSHVSALAADDYPIEGENLVERFYKMLPGVHQLHDTLSNSELALLSPAVVNALNALPPRLHGRGPLWRFLHATAAPLNVMRSSAEALRQLRDIDVVPPEFLPAMAHWLNWDLSRTLPVYAQRNEIRVAPRLYKSVGSVPNLRAIVNRYTTWYSQAAEFAQHITRSNLAPQLNLFGMMRGKAWQGTDDASVVLGLSTPNEGVKGTTTTSAKLTSANTEPFALRPAMEIAITADNRIPVAVRFEPGSFSDITQASAAEVCDVLNGALSELTASPVAGAIELRSNTIGTNSVLKIERYAASLISLENAPRGRLSGFADTTPTTDRVRFFYQTADPLAPATEQVALRALRGKPVEGETVWLPAVPQGSIRYKTLRGGAWGESFPLPVTPGAAQSDPAATTVNLGGPGIFAAWIDKSNLLSNAAAILGFEAGNDIAVGGITPATLTSANAEPFPLAPNMEIAITIDRLMPVVVRFLSNDFTDITAATAAEVARVINRTLFGAEANARADGRLGLSSRGPAATSMVRFENQERMRFAVGTARASLPARLIGQRSAPFDIPPGSRLVLQGNFSEIQAVQFSASDFANPRSATALEIVTVLNARLTRVVASVEPNGTIALKTLSSGGDERLSIDLEQSSAFALGFDHNNHTAVGDWGDKIDWTTPADVTSAPAGKYADLFAAFAAGQLWLFWCRHINGIWQIETSRWNGTTWTTTNVLTSSGRANREPCAVFDTTNRLWLFWSQLTGDDTWTLRRQVFDPITSTWSPEAALTTLPAGATRVADREPGAVRMAGGEFEIFFNSDRLGGSNLWSLTFQPATATASAPVAITSGPASDHSPTPLLVSGGSLWLLFRSDRSIPLSRVATRSLPIIDNRITSPPVPVQLSSQSPSSSSVRMTDTGTLRRFVGTTTVVLTDAARNTRRRLWDDLLSYTPQKPLGVPAEAALLDDELYTRGTVGLYLSQVIPETPLSQQMVKRLLLALERFLPINVRVVVVLAPRVDIEFVYGEGKDIDEKYQDKYPFIELFSGPQEQLITAVLPELSLLLSTTPGHVSADPANLPTLRRRSFFPPPT